MLNEESDLQAEFMLSRRCLVAFLLLGLSFGFEPTSSLLFATHHDNPAHHNSDQLLTDNEEEIEKSQAVWSELENLLCGLCSVEIEPQPTTLPYWRNDSADLPQGLLTTPDHTRAPPAC